MKKIAIDMHAHAHIAEAAQLAREQDGWRKAMERDSRQMGRESAERNRHLMETRYMAGFTRLDARLSSMDGMGIDVQAVSAAPPQFYYWSEREAAKKIVAATNHGIADLCAKRPERLVGLGTVSLQFPELAVSQLEHAVRELKLKGVIVSTTAGDRELADATMEPFWRKAQELGALVFIHPAGCSMEGRLSSYYFYNVVGNPLETTIALAKLVFAGVLDRYRELKICAAHGGGYFPFYISRFDHGWEVRPESHTCQNPPSHYLKRIWFDSLVYTPEQLGFLIQQTGPDRVVLGTDFPFDMGVENPVANLEAVSGLSDPEHDAIRGGNGASLLGISR